jgi:hypothetical protein
MAPLGKPTGILGLATRLLWYWRLVVRKCPVAAVSAAARSDREKEDGEEADSDLAAKFFILMLRECEAVPRSYSGTGAAGAVQILLEPPM